jgi:hypothetical protein
VVGRAARRKGVAAALVYTTPCGEFLSTSFADEQTPDIQFRAGGGSTFARRHADATPGRPLASSGDVLMNAARNWYQEHDFRKAHDDSPAVDSTLRSPDLARRPSSSCTRPHECPYHVHRLRPTGSWQRKGIYSGLSTASISLAPRCVVVVLPAQILRRGRTTGRRTRKPTRVDYSRARAAGVDVRGRMVPVLSYVSVRPTSVAWPSFVGTIAAEWAAHWARTPLRGSCSSLTMNPRHGCRSPGFWRRPVIKCTRHQVSMKRSRR